MAKVKCTAAGDAMVFRRLPGAYEGFEELQAFIGQGDFRFVNLETTVHRFETCGAALSGGSWFCAEPEVLDDLRTFGFNILSTANNHALDYGIAGLEKTLDYIRAAGFPSAGTGRNLAEAGGPVYLDTLAGRFALIAGCSSLTEDCMAGEQSRTMPGRPGLNGIRCTTTYQLPKEQMEQLKAIADSIYINASGDLSREQGYAPAIPEGKAVFGSLQFEEAEQAGVVTHVKKSDMTRTLNAIREAKFFADYVVVAMHSHQMRGRDKEMPAQFFEEFAHACIDAGANAIVGSGCHQLRPIEIYKDCPIFYSLADFILENETMKLVPPGMFEKQGLTGNECMADMYEDRSGGGKHGLYYQQEMFEAVVPYWEAEDGKLTCLKLLPVELHYGEHRAHGGLPSPNRDKGILERLAKMSKRYGTEIEIRDGYGIVKL